METVQPVPAPLSTLETVHEQRDASSEARYHPTHMSTSTHISSHQDAAPSHVRDYAQITPPQQAAMNQAGPLLLSQGLNNSASQESVVSEFSNAGSLAPGLQSSSSNLSTSTFPETELTSPASSTGRKHPMLHSHQEAARAAAIQLSNVQTDSIGRLRTPGSELPFNGQLVAKGINASSPIAVDTPYLQQLHQASKRTASGTIKPASNEVTATSMSPTKPTYGHSRSSSAVDGSNRQRISELSAQLKTRLSYAMVKVQHGWENRSLDELEQNMPTSSAPARIPMTPTSTNRTPRHISRPSLSSAVKAYGPPYTEQSQRYAHSPDGFTAHSPASQPALLRRRTSSSSGDDRPAGGSPRTYASFWAQHERNPVPAGPSFRRHAHNTSTSTVTSTTPSLAPAADVVSSASKRRSQHGRPPPQLSTAGSAQRATPKGQLLTPRTPRQNLLRMPSQQAEKDAVDTLLFMSSPNNSSNMKHSSHASPLRSEFPTDFVR